MGIPSIKGLRALIVALLFSSFIVACGDATPSGPIVTPVAIVRLESPRLVLTIGETITMVATPRSASGQPLQRPVEWASSNESRATVNASGLVTAVGAGAVTITASSEGKSASLEVTVAPSAPAPVADVRLSADAEVLLAWNGSMTLGAVALDATGTELPGREVQWLTSKPSVASVSPTGLVRATGTGTAMVTAMIEGVAASVSVRVLPAPAVAIVLDAVDPGLEIGETVFFSGSVRRESGEITAGPLAWLSDRPEIATVESRTASIASVSAHRAGTFTLTASVDGISTSLTLRVTPRPTYDLIYSRHGGGNTFEIFTLGLNQQGAQPVRLNAGSVSRDPSPSPDGAVLVFAVSQLDQHGQQQDDLYTVGRNGLNMRRLTQQSGVEDEPAWSPDGARIAFRRMSDGGHIWTINADGTGLTNVTAQVPADLSDMRNPAWSPDGERIAFVAARNGAHKIWTIKADGTGLTQITTDGGFDTSPTWSPAGDQLAFTRYNAANPTLGWDVMIVSAHAGATPVRLALPGDQLLPAWSPDGHYLTVTGTVVAGQGIQNVYTMRTDGSGLRLRTVNAAWGGGLSPAWIRRQP